MEKKDTKVVILCGGKGTRLREISELIPKPLVPIGEMPILWHIMKGYSVQGYRKFIICLGYKGGHIRNFFLNYLNHKYDITIDMKTGDIKERKNNTDEDWEVTLVNTGEETNTGGRVYAIKKYLENDPYFMLTYGDGVSNVDFSNLLSFHQNKNTVVTITGIKAHSKYGQVKADEKGIAISFVEKPLLDDRVNGGFMVLNREFLEHHLLEKNIPIEEILENLTSQRKISIYHHEGFWHCMDTPQHFEFLNHHWKSGNAPWKTW